MIDRRVSALLAIVLVLLAISGCASDQTSGDDPGDQAAEDRPAEQLLGEPDDPQPVNLPEDAAPHDRLSEWWYYTGHLEGPDGALYGFQFVIFQALRGDFPPSYAAHFAITDTTSGEFHYAERVETGAQEPGERPVDLQVGDWTLQGGVGLDQISADMDGYELELTLESEKEPVLHDGDGYFEFAPAAESYYYSRTRLKAEGTLTIGGEAVEVHGEAWFDQQWGDFLMLGDAGWDWFSAQLDNGQELMAWQSHDGDGNVLDGSATIVRENGDAIDVSHDGLEIQALDQWQSTQTGATYPHGWLVTIPEHDIELRLEPVMEDQELITVESTGQIYWEGLVEIQGDWEGAETTGRGYVELTGYADASAE